MPHAEIASHQAVLTLKQLHAELAGKILDNKAEAERLREGEAVVARRQQNGRIPATKQSQRSDPNLG